MCMTIIVNISFLKKKINFVGFYQFIFSNIMLIYSCNGSCDVLGLA
jgi:hypothetical protein